MTLILDPEYLRLMELVRPYRVDVDRETLEWTHKPGTPAEVLEAEKKIDWYNEHKHDPW